MFEWLSWILYAIRDGTLYALANWPFGSITGVGAEFIASIIMVLAGGAMYVLGLAMVYVILRIVLPILIRIPNSMFKAAKWLILIVAAILTIIWIISLS